MRYIRSKPVLCVDTVRLSEAGVSQREFTSYFPRFLRESLGFECSGPMYAWLQFVQFLIQTSIKLILRPRPNRVGNLDINEIEQVYNREAATYDVKHHMTTYGMDTTWRRLASWSVATFSRSCEDPIAVLDLCTGTGLTVREIVVLLSHFGVRGRVIGLDYNVKMLEIAKTRKFTACDMEVIFVRSNAMNLTDRKDGFACFQPEVFEFVTQIFGIGGISEPLKVFQEVLKVLKPGGQFFLIDMHQPLADQPAEWPFLWRWFRSPRLEAMTYEKTTIPLALNRLWGWRDPTLDFYILPLVTYQDTHGNRWGFKVINFEVETQRWWLGLPLMPIGKIVVEKVRIDKDISSTREKILSLVAH